MHLGLLLTPGAQLVNAGPAIPLPQPPSRSWQWSNGQADDISMEWTNGAAADIEMERSR